MFAFKDFQTVIKCPWGFCMCYIALACYQKGCFSTPVTAVLVMDNWWSWFLGLVCGVRSISYLLRCNCLIYLKLLILVFLLACEVFDNTPGLCVPGVLVTLKMMQHRARKKKQCSILLCNSSWGGENGFCILIFYLETMKFVLMTCFPSRLAYQLADLTILLCFGALVL